MSQKPPEPAVSLLAPGWRLWVLLAGLVIRVLFALSVGHEDSFGGWDGKEYHAYANCLLHFQGDEYPRFFNFVRAPGYPLFLMPFIAVGPNHVWHIQLFQAFLGVGQMLVLSSIAARWAGRRTADILMVLASFHPFLIFYCGSVLTETVFIFLLWTSIACLQRLLGKQPVDWWRWIAWAGVSMGFGCLVRPALQPFLVVAVFWLGWISKRRLGAFRAWAHMGVFTAVVSAILLPWQLGYFWVHGEFTLGPGYGKAVYLQSNSMEFFKMYETKSKDEYYQLFTTSCYHLSVTNGVPRSTWMAEAAAFQKEHPTEWRRMQWYKTVHFWRPWLNPMIFPRKLLLISLVWATPVFALGACEVWRRWRRRETDVFYGLLLSVLISGYLIGGIFFVASVRYRIPMVDTTFLILTASFLANCRGRRQTDAG